MELHQGNILFINLNPAKGTETKKERPCMVVSNDEYNRHLNTVLAIPISSSDKYQAQERFVQSPFFKGLTWSQFMEPRFSNMFGQLIPKTI